AKPRVGESATDDNAAGGPPTPSRQWGSACQGPRRRHDPPARPWAAAPAQRSGKVVMQHGKYRFIVGFLALPLGLYALFVVCAFMINVGGRRRRGGPVISGVRGSSFYKIVYFFPQVLSIAIVALLFAFAYNPDSGAINSLLRGIGLDSVQPLWLGDPSLALWC